MEENAEAVGNPAEASVPFCVLCEYSLTTRMIAINEKIKSNMDKQK